MKYLSSYTGPVKTAILLFIPIAILFTLPFMIYQYRRYGGIPILRVLMVFGFIFYMECAFLLTVLPLPDRSKVAAMTGSPFQLIPFSTYADAFRNAGFRLSEPISFITPACWGRLLRSHGLFEILANIVMQIPLGIFLRYYFGCSWKKTLLIGFCVSLFYELVQLSGLFFIYPRPYRVVSVDDLIDNTLGAMIGYWIAPLFCAILPTREQLDKQSMSKERRITLPRCLAAFAIDWLIFGLIIGIVHFLVPGFDANCFVMLSPYLFLGWILLLFVLGQAVFHGQTPGKTLLRIRVVATDEGDEPHLNHMFIRYFILLGLYPLQMLVGLCALAGLILCVVQDVQWLRLVGIIGLILLALFIVWRIKVNLKKHGGLSHRHWSRTKIVVLPRMPKAAGDKPEENRI